jgi:hypothetical protein
VFESRLSHGCLPSSFCVVLSCVGRDLCDGPMIRSKESYQVSKYIKETFSCEAAKVLTRTANSWSKEEGKGLTAPFLILSH